MKPIKHMFAGALFAVITLLSTGTASANLVSDSRRALQQLVAQNPALAVTTRTNNLRFDVCGARPQITTGITS